MNTVRIVLACVRDAAGLAAVAVRITRSSGQFDTSKSFEINGVVSRVDWVNPHTYVHVDVKQATARSITYSSNRCRWR